MVEVLFTDHDQGIKNLVLDCLDDSLHVRSHIGGTRGHLGDFDVCLAEDLIEGEWVLHVVVAE